MTKTVSTTKAQTKAVSSAKAQTKADTFSLNITNNTTKIALFDATVTDKEALYVNNILRHLSNNGAIVKTTKESIEMLSLFQADITAKKQDPKTKQCYSLLNKLRDMLYVAYFKGDGVIKVEDAIQGMCWNMYINMFIKDSQNIFTVENHFTEIVVKEIRVVNMPNATIRRLNNEYGLNIAEVTQTESYDEFDMINHDPNFTWSF